MNGKWWVNDTCVHTIIGKKRGTIRPGLRPYELDLLFREIYKTVRGSLQLDIAGENMA